jgi:hypothetical protein
MSFMQSRGRMGAYALDNETMMRHAPSIFAVDKHASRSERYTYIPTIEIVDGMRANGFEPFFVRQGKSRIEGKAEFTKHLIRFRWQGEAQPTGVRRVGDVFPEVALVNSHDGTSSYQLSAGLMRLVCLNGMVVSDRQFGSVKLPHKGDVIGQVIEGSFEVIEESRKALEVAREWSGITLDAAESRLLAGAVHSVRFADSEGEVNTPIQPEQLLGVRRHDDRPNDLWTISNRIQENAIRGGLSAMGRDALNRPRMTTTREVRAIDGDMKLNKAIWALTEQMAALKR